MKNRKRCGRALATECISGLCVATSFRAIPISRRKDNSLCARAVEMNLPFGLFFLAQILNCFD